MNRPGDPAEFSRQDYIHFIERERIAQGFSDRGFSLRCGMCHTWWHMVKARRAIGRDSGLEIGIVHTALDALGYALAIKKMDPDNPNPLNDPGMADYGLKAGRPRTPPRRDAVAGADYGTLIDPNGGTL